MTMTDESLWTEMVKTSKIHAILKIEMMVRQRIRELRNEQQEALIQMVTQGQHARPEETMTNKLFEARLLELEDVVSWCSFFQEAFELESKEQDVVEVDNTYTETVV